MMPHRAPVNNDSIVAMFWPVASPNRPPKVMIGARHAKYRKKIDAND